MATIMEDVKVCKDCKWCDKKKEYRSEEVLIGKKGETKTIDYFSHYNYTCGRRVRNLVTGEWGSMESNAFFERNNRTDGHGTLISDIDLGICGSSGRFYEEG